MSSPADLKVRIFLHEIEYEKEIFSCWSYVTDGLLTQKQKEIIFTLRRYPGQKPEEYPRELLDLFATFFHCAERGTARRRRSIDPVWRNRNGGRQRLSRYRLC